MLQAGAIQVCITPPIGVELAGYGRSLHRRSQDIHDDITAQALVLDDGQNRYALITSDLIAVSADLTAQIRADVAKGTRIPADHVMVSCCHSHTAPTSQTFREWGALDRSYVRSAGRLMAGAVVAAENRLQPAALSLARSSYPYLAWNRISGSDVDPTVEVVQLTGKSGQPIAILVHYACHPVILGPKPIVSADYPGAMRRALNVQFPGAVAMFANGACGNIDPVTNRDVWGKGTFEDVERIGGELAAVAADALKQAEPVADVTLHSRGGSVELPYAVPTLKQIDERIAAYSEEARKLRGPSAGFGAPAGQAKMPNFWLGYYKALRQRIESGQQPKARTAELQAFFVGDALALIGIPAEVFSAQGMAIREASPYAHALSVCYTNGVYSYLPPKSEFETKGYTAFLAAAAFDAPPYRSDVAERLMKAVTKLVQ